MEWNLADLFELVADTCPERAALQHGIDGVTRTWSDLERRANALARHFSRQHEAGAKIAIYSHNRPEFVETLIGAMKARLVPVNVNYRYLEDELVYLFDNSDSEIVVYEATYADRIANVRDRVSRVREWVELEDGAPVTRSRRPTSRSRDRARNAWTFGAAPTICFFSTPGAPRACRRG